MRNEPEHRPDEPEKSESKENTEDPEPAAPREAGWNYLDVMAVALVIVSLVLILGVVNFGVLVNATIYILTVAMTGTAVLHWLKYRRR